MLSKSPASHSILHKLLCTQSVPLGLENSTDIILCPHITNQSAQEKKKKKEKKKKLTKSLEKN